MGWNHPTPVQATLRAHFKTYKTPRPTYATLTHISPLLRFPYACQHRCCEFNCLTSFEMHSHETVELLFEEVELCQKEEHNMLHTLREQSVHLQEKSVHLQGTLSAHSVWVEVDAREPPSQL